MTRRLHNWKYRDAITFLKENGFSYFKPLKGSHQAWIKRGDKGEPDRIVEVSLPRDSYPILTLKTMIRQSGIPENKWIRWAGS
jgi:predicted RNA binding protein YcfA (HicA-like mRNA interferase family)